MTGSKSLKNDLDGKRLAELVCGLPSKAALLNVAVWLENGCNPMHAGAELRLLAGKIVPAVETPNSQWQSVATGMPPPGANVLAFFRNELGKRRTIRAMWAAPMMLEQTSITDEEGDYDEKSDTYYVKEGWYETNEFEETHWRVTDPVTHWMHLPTMPLVETTCVGCAQGWKRQPGYPDTTKHVHCPPQFIPCSAVETTCVGCAQGWKRQPGYPDTTKHVHCPPQFIPCSAVETAARPLMESSFTVYESSTQEELQRFRTMITALLQRHADRMECGCVMDMGGPTPSCKLYNECIAVKTE